MKRRKQLVKTWKESLTTGNRFVCVFLGVHVTCLVCDIDGSAGCWAVSSTSDSVDSDGVVCSGLQVIDRGSRLIARNCELLRVTVTSWGSKLKSFKG